MGAKLVTVSVINKTPYTWHYTPQSRGVIIVNGGCTMSYKERYYVKCNICFRHGDDTTMSFKYEFDTTDQIYWYNITFIIRETQDRSQIELHCRNDGGTLYCPNYENTEDENQRKQEEERRLEDDAAAIERDRVTDVEEKFKELLLKYQDKFTEDKEHLEIWDRIKARQNELVDQYCRENNLSAGSQFTFDQAVGYNKLSLTEKLTVLEASLQFILNSSTEDAKDDEDQPLGWEKKYDFLLGLVKQLHSTNPTLADHILLSLLDMMSEISPQSRKILGQMLSNRIWTPTEIMLFICKSPAIKCDQLDSVLHTAQTDHLDCILVLSALTKEDPLMFLQKKTARRKFCCC
ncbi:uncharacterized protein LOC127511211 [Ctenopharyngodon idella]|uniref:uncharacterized protein LOC127511211 n=1 Tax=Ctenopharyngodon idella TaxID=7959 RepID=UPI002231F434|nr:uncharacterized protein LOC127511211 [Ctenopharyngodon idella]